MSKVQLLTQRAQRILDPQTTRTRQVGNPKLLEKCNPMKKTNPVRPTGLNGSTNLCSGKLKANWPRRLGKNIRLFCRKQHMARMVMMMMMMMMTTATLMIRRVRNGKRHLPPPTATSSIEHQCMHRLLIRIARNCFSFRNLPKVLKSEVHPALP